MKTRKHWKKPPEFWNQILWREEIKLNLYRNDGKIKKKKKLHKANG